MVGIYADAPGPQIMFDKDGSGGFYVPSASSTPTALTAAQMKDILDVSSGTGYYATDLRSGGVLYGVLFSELRDLVAYYIAHNNNTDGGNSVSVQNLQTSTNTTNGYDGAWTTVAASPTWSTSVAGYRTPTALTMSGIKAIRFNPYQTGGAAGGGSSLLGFHIYGAPSSGQALDRLRIWHPTLDQELTGPGLDYGEIGRGGTVTKTFRVKNNSTSLTANAPVVSFEALPADASPTVVSQMAVSIGSGYASTQTLPNIAPTAISGVVTLQFTTSGSTALGLYRQRIIVTAASWS